ncbi:uncharacterized protein [Ptychodera flava]|uniref:uncharacterized protein n=1 Tax=Ptychodera flava TaxID=63121 RepID=UPI00396A0A29
MEKGSLEELAARRRRAIAKTKFIKTLSEEREFVSEVDELKEGLGSLKAKLEEYREKKRRIQMKLKKKRQRAPSCFEDHYVNFMFSASAICMAVFVAMHFFRFIVLFAFPELLMDCAIIVDKSAEVTKVDSFSIAWQLLLSRLPCESVVHDDECEVDGNDACMTLSPENVG